jgi:putative transposase
MLEFLLLFLRGLFAGCQSHSGLVLENLALRHQLAVLKRQARKPKLRSADRLLWVGLRRIWPPWQQALLLFQPQTIIAWHRLGFRLFWRWKSRTRAGRPSVDGELIGLIHRMWQANPTWGSRRIQAELAKLGLEAATATIRKYRPKSRRRPSQGWWTFLQNHAGAMAAMDFFVVPTVTFRLLYVLIVIKMPLVGGLHHHDLRQAA